MTIEELKELIAHGAAQPGIYELEEMMRLAQLLDEQARAFAGITATSFTTTATSSGAIFIPAAAHADLG